MAYTNIDDPSAFFHTLLWTGNGANNRALTNDANAGNFKPDWVWIKPRSAAEWHNVYDSSRGVNKGLYTNSTYQEESLSQTFESFDTNGFTVSYNSAYSSVFTNKNSTTYIAWQWKANGGSTSSNTDGTITSTVQANTDAGFSIVTWTGNESASATVGHGLGVAPDMWIAKRRNGTYNWQVYTSALAPIGSNNLILTLNSTAAAEQVSGTSFTSSSTFQPSSNAKRNSGNMIAYCFASKQGYSKVGSYIGNGFANGPFVYTGFKPAFVLVKNTSSAYDWRLLDSSRNTFNAADLLLMPNNNSAEFDGSTHGTNMGIDFVSNGFKLRTNYGGMNTSGHNFIYMAFAENPFVTSTGVPTTAR
jgi:hypothetical protein